MKKEIELKFNQLTLLTGLNKKENCKEYLGLDFAACYGGYRLVMIQSGSGGHYGAFGKSSACSRMKAKEFICYLDGLIEGIEFIMGTE